MIIIIIIIIIMIIIMIIIIMVIIIHVLIMTNYVSIPTLASWLFSAPPNLLSCFIRNTVANRGTTQHIASITLETYRAAILDFFLC